MNEENQNNPENSKKPTKVDSIFPIQEYRLIPAEHVQNLETEQEIDLMELVRVIWDNRIVVYRSLAVGFVIGILSVLFTVSEYVSNAKLMPEYSNESQSGASSLLQQYGGLLGLGGGTYNSSSNAIRVDLYPDIVQSLTFMDKLARQEFYFSDVDTTTDLYTYYLELKSPGFGGYLRQYTIGLPGMIIGAFKTDDQGSVSFADTTMLALSENEAIVIEILRANIEASLDDESGIITVSARMNDPILAASMTKYVVEELTAYLIEYRTEKVLRDLDYVSEQLTIAENRYNLTQIELAEFRDANQGTLTAKARTQEERLQSENQIAFNVYNTLVQQYEEAKLKVQEETPVFKTLQPVNIPATDESSAASTLISFLMLSGVFGVGYIFARRFINNFIS